MAQIYTFFKKQQQNEKIATGGAFASLGSGFCLPYTERRLPGKKKNIAPEKKKCILSFVRKLPL